MRWLGVIATTLVIGGAARVTSAQSPPAPTLSVELGQIAGTKGTAQIPANWPELGSTPFTIYNHYEVASAKTLTLSSTKVSEKLVDGSTFEAGFTQVGTAPNVTWKVEITIKDSSGVLLSTGKYPAPTVKAKVFPISLPYKDGNLVIGLRPS
jgi:hypothetical protein